MVSSTASIPLNQSSSDSARSRRVHVNRAATSNAVEAALRHHFRDPRQPPVVMRQQRIHSGCGNS